MHCIQGPMQTLLAQDSHGAQRQERSNLFRAKTNLLHLYLQVGKRGAFQIYQPIPYFICRWTLRSSLDLLLAMYSAKVLWFLTWGWILHAQHRTKTLLVISYAGWINCILQCVILSFLSVEEIRYVYKEQTDSKDGTICQVIAEGAYFSYPFFLGVISWSPISLLQLCRSRQTTYSETPSACSVKRGCVSSAGGVFREGSGGKCKQHAFPQPLSQLPQPPSPHHFFRSLGPLSSAHLSDA